MPIGTAPRFWSWGWHRFEKLRYGCRDTAISMCLAPTMFLRHRESIVETENMSSVETRHMSQQQSSVLSTAEICLVSTEDIYPVSTENGTNAGLRPAAVMSSVESG